jgi:nucleotide-binding universal stress UspA family protein
MRFERIVIGVDFSTASLNAVRWVAAHFAPRAKLVLAHVVPRPHTPAFLRDRSPAAGDAVEPTLYPGLSGFADLAGARWTDVAVREGRPEHELAALAHDVGADLICVGRSQRRRGAGRFGATTPQRLLARTSAPVLVVPAEARLPPVSLLAAVSDGAEGERVLRAAAALATAWDARVDVLHSVDPAIAAAGDAAGQVRAVAELTEAWLERRVSDVPMPGRRVTTIAHVGEASDAIISHATRATTDLVVIGRRTEPDDVVAETGCIGSTTRMVTWAAPCPVLIVGSPVRARPVGDLVFPHRVSERRFAELGGRRGIGAPARQRIVFPPGGGDAA